MIVIRVRVLGLGPIGQMACRIARHRGAELVIGVDLVPERLERARSWGIEVLDVESLPGGTASIAEAMGELTDGRGPDSAIDAVGIEAHGSPLASLGHRLTTFVPDRLAERLMLRIGSDRLTALHTAIELIRRGGTISVVGVYGGQTDPMPMVRMFDKQLTVRMGQANVRRWIDDILPLLVEDDPLGVDDFATQRLPLDAAPDAYAMFQKKRDGAVKVLFRP